MDGVWKFFKTWIQVTIHTFTFRDLFDDESSWVISRQGLRMLETKEGREELEILKKQGIKNE